MLLTASLIFLLFLSRKQRERKKSYGIPPTIRTDHGSEFKNDIVKHYCSSRVIVHILSPVGDLRGSGLAERSIQPIKRKLGTENFDANYIILNQRFIKLLKIYVIANTQCLKNCTSNYILVENQILSSLMRFIMLLNLLL